MSAAIKAIKGFNRDMTCRGMKFEPGQTYEVAGPIKACHNGIHSCPVDADTSPFAVFEYYTPGTSRYFEVEASGETDRDGNKIASAKVTVGVEVSIGDLTARFIEWVMSRTDKKLRKSNSGDHGAASNSGDYGAASNSGDYGAASNSGYGGAASNSGYGGAASNSGDYGAASNSGDYGAASNSGTRGAASNSGYGGAASNSGTRGAASNSGYGGAASNSGYGGAAISHAYYGKVMCEGDGHALYCTEFSDDGSIKSVACGITGKEGVKAGVWYHCCDGKLVECTA